MSGFYDVVWQHRQGDHTGRNSDLKADQIRAGLVLPGRKRRLPAHPCPLKTVCLVRLPLMVSHRNKCVSFDCGSILFCAMGTNGMRSISITKSTTTATQHHHVSCCTQPLAVSLCKGPPTVPPLSKPPCSSHQGSRLNPR